MQIKNGKLIFIHFSPQKNCRSGLRKREGEHLYELKNYLQTTKLPPKQPCEAHQPQQKLIGILNKYFQIYKFIERQRGRKNV